jgi:spermidine synthase
MSQRPFQATPLLFATLLIAICSIVYELIIGGLSSYLLGNSVTQFSITIGLYLFAMGIGSFVSKYIHKKLFDMLTLVEITIGVLGSFSSLLLFICHIYTQIYPLVMYMMTLSIGLLVGIEIPLLVRIIESHQQNIKS